MLWKTNPNPMIELRDVSFHYASNVPVFSHMNMDVNDGEILGIYGENGCGKSTLLKIIKKELSIQEGTYVQRRELNIHHLKQNNKHIVEASILTVMELLMMHKMKNKVWVGKKTHKEEIIQLLTSYGLQHIKDKQIRNLSGGQQQKVMIIKTLLQSPHAILLDEPLNALDEQSQNMVIDMIKKLKENHISVLLVLHNKALLSSICDRVLLCENFTLNEMSMN